MTEAILIVGSGTREHAIAAALARSPQRPRLFCFGSTRNPGIEALCAVYAIGNITDPTAVLAFAAPLAPTLAIIGPEAPLAAGAADALQAIGIPVVGPTKSLARIESSKSFTRDLLAKYKIPGNPFFQRFTSVEGVEAVLARFPDRHVIKDDGLGVNRKHFRTINEFILLLAPEPDDHPNYNEAALKVIEDFKAYATSSGGTR